MNSDHENECTFASPTFKVEENKMPLFLGWESTDQPIWTAFSLTNWQTGREISCFDYGSLSDIELFQLDGTDSKLYGTGWEPHGTCWEPHGTGWEPLGTGWEPHGRRWNLYGTNILNWRQWFINLNKKMKISPVFLCVTL